MHKKILIGLVIFLILLSPIAAQNWNSYQGDIDHNGFREEQSDFVSNLWIFNTNNPVHTSPAIYDEYIYIVTDNGIIHAIDMESGEEEWNLDLKSSTNSSPIIHSSKLYIGCEDGLKAVNINTHKIIWEYECSNVESTPTYYNDKIYFTSDDGHIYAVSEKGKLEFNKKLDGKLKSSPIIINDTIYTASTNAKIYSINLDKSKNWEFTTGDEILSSPTYTNNTIIFGSTDGNLYCLNTSNGNLIWKTDLNNKIISSPTLDEHDNSIYIGSDEGNLTCLDLRDGLIKWSHPTGDKVQSTPALKDNLISFGSNNGYFYILNKYTGAEEFNYNPGTILFNTPISSSAVINGNSLFFTDMSGSLYSLNIDKYEVPTSQQLFYSMIVLIIVVIVIIVCVRFIKGRNK